MKKRVSKTRRIAKKAPQIKITRTVLYIVTSVIVLLVIVAGLQQPQRTKQYAQMAQLTPPVPSQVPQISGPEFGCLGGNCPMQISPAVSGVPVSPGAGAPVPGVSAAVPKVSGAPGAQNPEAPGVDPEGNPLEFLENPNGKVPPGRAKNFLEQLMAFFAQLLGGGAGGKEGGDNPGIHPGNGNGVANGLNKGNKGPGGGGGEEEEDEPEEENPEEGDDPAAPNEDPANGGNEGAEKPGFGNNPGTINPGGHMMAPGAPQKQVEENPEGEENPQQGADAPQATNGGVVKPDAKQPAQQNQNPIQAFISLLTKLFGGK